MSSGGVFKIITNDGKQDRMIMATALLNQRLADIERLRAANPAIKDSSPTLADIERTHILFMNAHFKPFAAIGYEYNKQQAQSGQAQLGNTVTFSIRQFGDFFSDMMLHLRLGSVTADGVTDANQYLRYCDNLGQRVVQKVEFSVNSNPLDEYNSVVQTFHEKFMVGPNKQAGWDKLMAQERPHAGFMDSAAGRGGGVREKLAICDGPQTAKVTQPAVDMYVPLLFWFNKDPRLAIPSVSIPYGQRFINVSLARTSQILQHVGVNATDDAPGANPAPTPSVEVCTLYVNNIFVNPEIHAIYIRRIGFSLVRVHRYQHWNTQKPTENVLLSNLKWPIETLYVGLQPTENVDETSPKMLESWHVFAQTVDNTYTSCSLANTFFLTAAPVDTLAASINAVLGSTLGIDLSAAVATPNPTVAQLNAEILAAFPAALQGTVMLYDANLFVDPLAPTAAELLANAPSVHCQGRYTTCVPTVDELTITAHGIPLYNKIPADFFEAYVPYTYGGTHITTPSDCGALMIPFCLYPGSYQPSGHINTSRAREFYLEFSSPQVGPDYSANLEVVGIAINFLLVSDGSAIMRYST